MRALLQVACNNLRLTLACIAFLFYGNTITAESMLDDSTGILERLLAMRLIRENDVMRCHTGYGKYRCMVIKRY